MAEQMTGICEHQRFFVKGTVARLTDGDDGPVTGYSLDVEVRCDDCNEPFHFVGLPHGMSLVGGAYASLDETELRVKIAPGRNLPSFLEPKEPTQ
jgi:hypothetical protein